MWVCGRSQAAKEDKTANIAKSALGPSNSVSLILYFVHLRCVLVVLFGDTEKKSAANKPQSPHLETLSARIGCEMQQTSHDPSLPPWLQTPFSAPSEFGTWQCPEAALQASPDRAAHASGVRLNACHCVGYRRVHSEDQRTIGGAAPGGILGAPDNAPFDGLPACPRPQRGPCE